MHMHMPHVHARAHGSRCVGEVKSVGQIAADAAVAQIDNLTGNSGSSDPMAGARMSQAQASKAASKPPVITKSSAPAKPLTMDELIANSIEQKAGVLGRSLSTLNSARAVTRLLRLLRARRAALGSSATGPPRLSPSQPPPKSQIPRPLDPPRPLNAEEQAEMAVKVKKLFAL